MYGRQVLLIACLLQFPCVGYADDCRQDADCVVVQEGWCKGVLAIASDRLKFWPEENKARTAKAKQDALECKPNSERDPAKYIAKCVQGECVVAPR